MKYILSILLVSNILFARAEPIDIDQKIDTGIHQILSHIQEPQIPDREINLVEFAGVSPDAAGTHDFQPFIASAIEKLSSQGGGSLIFPHTGDSGELVYRICGPIEMKSNIALRLARGTRLQFEFAPEAYRPNGRGVLSRYEGTLLYTHSPLIRAFNCTNIAITGQSGTGPLPVINGAGKQWRKWEEAGNKSRSAAGQDGAQASYLQVKAANNNATPISERRFDTEFLRPSTMQFFCSKQILVQDIRIENSPFWTIHPLFSENLTFRRIQFETLVANNDGIDPESSKYVLIEDINFHNGDDNIAVKSGRDLEGREGAPIQGTELENVESSFISDGKIGGPTQYVLIRNCTFRGHYAVCIGSEMSGGANHIYVLDNHAEYPVRMGFYIKGGRNRGGVVHDVYVKNLALNEVKKEVIRLIPNYDNDLTSPWPSKFHNIYIENMTAKKAGSGIRIFGWPDATIDDVCLRNIVVDEVAEMPPLQYNNTRNIVLENVLLNGKDYSGSYEKSDKSIPMPR